MANKNTMRNRRNKELGSNRPGFGRRREERRKANVATFKDFNGQVRLFNVWYPMPFLANIKRGESTFPYCTIPTPNQPLRSMLFWLGTDGNKYHAESNVWTQDLSKTHWGVFNEGWYEI